MPYMNRICNQDVGTRECVKVRENARTHSDGLLTWMQVLSVGTPVALAKENVAHSECRLGSVQLFRCYLRTYIQRQLALLLLP